MARMSVSKTEDVSSNLTADANPVRSMVGQRTLTAQIVVQIHGGVPLANYYSCQYIPYCEDAVSPLTPFA